MFSEMYGAANPTSIRLVTPTVPQSVATLASMFKVRRSTSNGAVSSVNWLAVATSDPSRGLRRSRDENWKCWKVTPSEARPRPAVRARSRKNGPKVCVGRSTVPSSGWTRKTNAPDEDGTGSVARLARSAREIVSLVACAASRSRSTLPVWTDWFVTRKPRTSPSVCACAGGTHASEAAIAIAAACSLVVIIFLRYADRGRSDCPVRLHVAFAVDVAALSEVAALRLLEVGRLVNEYRSPTGREHDRRAAAEDAGDRS